MSMFYTQFEGSVIVDGNLSEWFPMESGVWQGCILSPIFFLLATDWVMRKATADRPRGIQWTPFSQLDDLDFADNLAALSSKHPQEKTARLNTFTKQTGLNISASKAQVMCINATPDAPITVNGNPLDFAEDFNYLSSLINKDNAVQKDIRARLSKAHSACCASALLEVKEV